MVTELAFPASGLATAPAISDDDRKLLHFSLQVTRALMSLRSHGRICEGLARLQERIQSPGNGHGSPDAELYSFTIGGPHSDVPQLIELLRELEKAANENREPVMEALFMFL